ncbi:GNAT family N-acetyltransferase [Staphylococcus simiae]|uniref:GNAT family N-acetyltransferase n=1 Tax=Staphylococcus simiae TaxID=308354 RepID=UPI001A962CCD|nr:GNAT family N-acetyltransferase [Staphylococcus simiae]MBO1199025.1 GNAT family N-acetyltransferase [Staphylococcus simiae]MBO1201293.1 GNAT family N-acetyltransferase [Staphylococcus simiae]MBO1203463.1 GNAT family N-acetyltransferase [Staphylococcus simiae]MBO1210991.1 GNAT family N-acetyltransferase [Staphylococcus simiae]MBO1229631.1 GNAT family N-acetyltransferase [Staphylococcus simiae]
MHFRHATLNDLDELIRIENIGFSEEERASAEALRERINCINDTFIVLEDNGAIAGYINGPVITQRYITDDLFEHIDYNPEQGGYLSILGVAVAPEYRHQGIAGRLLKYFEQLAQQHQRTAVTLTCKNELVSLYEHYGYINEGVSESSHGGITWYNLVKDVY